MLTLHAHSISFYMTYWYLEAFNEHLLHKINLQNLSVKALVNPVFIDNTHFFQMLVIFKHRKQWLHEEIFIVMHFTS